jgi:aspartate/tyrosine/aromatic aminotransferase
LKCARFFFYGLEIQVKILIEKYHIYLASNGRISIAGLNSKNVDYVVNAIHDTITSATL